VTPIAALVFDLYGTLLHVEDPAFEKGMARSVGAPRRDWALFLRDVVLVRPFADRAALVDAVLERFAAADPGAARATGLALLAREIASIRREPSLAAVLGFWRRRGLRIGVLTNSASPFREPFAAAGLEELVDAAVFSCDLGRKKPDPGTYGAVLARLGVEAAAALMIGDSLPNDVLAPERLGLRALGLGRFAERETLASFAEVAWLGGLARGEPRPLVAAGERIDFAGRFGRLARIDLLPDERQGRYNLVAEAGVAWDDGGSETMFLKRFRHPEAIYVEAFMRRLLVEVGLDACEVDVLAREEPLLLSRAAPGVKLVARPPDPPLAFEIGRHGASAYLFANADLRPRNSFLSLTGDGPRLTMVDYEYSLFDRAIDLSDRPDRMDPRALAALDADELRRRAPRRVVTRAAIQRTRRAFFDAKTAEAAVLDAFRAGWIEVHRSAQRAAPRLEELLRARLEREPPLVVGTESYRRAFLPIDIEDLLARIATAPDEACDACF